MKKTFLLFVSLFFTLMVAAQVPSFGWAKSIGSISLTMPNRVLSDAAGNVFVLGNYNNEVDFDPGPGTYTMVPSSGNIDAFLLKLSPAGNFVWVKSFGDEFALGLNQSNMSFDPAGNIVITGMYHGTADFDPGPATYTLGSTNGNPNNAYLLKLDPNGNFLWAKSFEGITSTGMMCFLDIQTDVSGNIHLVGFYNEQFDFDPDPAVTYTLAPSGPERINYAVVKLNGTGNLIWAKAIENTIGMGAEPNLRVATDQQGNVLFSGSFSGVVDFDPGAGNTFLTSGSVYFEGSSFVTKLDVNGNFVWAGQTDCSGGTWVANRGLVCDNAGNVYVCGGGSDFADLDPGPSAFSSTRTEMVDLGYVFKLDPAGNFVWGNFIDGNNLATCENLAFNNAGDLLILGDYVGTYDFDGGVGTYTLSSPGTQTPEQESFICSYSTAGAFLWAYGFGGATGGRSMGKSITVNNTNIYATGYFDVPGDYDPTAGTNILTHVGAIDTYILKLSTCAFPPSPLSSTAPANRSICAGTTTTLSVTTSTGTVNWYASATSFQPIGTGTVYVTPALAAGTYTYYADATTCGPSTTRTAITVTVTAFPVLTASTFSSTICSGSSSTLTASASSAVSYSWSTGASTASITVSPTVSTTYTVTGTNACGTVSVSVTQYVYSCTGINELINAGYISLYPNPAFDELSIVIPSQLVSNATIVEVSDALGKVVMKETLNHEINTFHITTLEDGMYFFRVISHNQTMNVGKVVKH